MLPLPPRPARLDARAKSQTRGAEPAELNRQENPLHERQRTLITKAAPLRGQREIRAAARHRAALQELADQAAYRMIQNTSIPDVAERPQDLVRCTAASARRRATGNARRDP
ncbi:hypothetical protein ACU4GD_45585 [Cupriavidus basilensis]